MAELTLEQFTERFVTHMCKVAGFTHFDDGMAVCDYADSVVASYFNDPDRRDEGPETCAEEDMEYWGED
jgi:hypothetical protein